MRSGAGAVAAVDGWGGRSPSLRAHASPYSTKAAAVSLISSGVTGAALNRAVKDSSCSGESKQSIRAPRGLWPTMSNRSSTSPWKWARAKAVCITLAEPGPPAPATSVPTRDSGSEVALRTSSTSVVGPSGSSWSNGTSTTAHEYRCGSAITRSMKLSGQSTQSISPPPSALAGWELANAGVAERREAEKRKALSAAATRSEADVGGVILLVSTAKRKPRLVDHKGQSTRLRQSTDTHPS